MQRQSAGWTRSRSGKCPSCPCSRFLHSDQAAAAKFNKALRCANALYRGCRKKRRSRIAAGSYVGGHYFATGDALVADELITRVRQLGLRLQIRLAEE